MRDYKIGDWVLYIDKEDSDGWKEDYGVSLYGKLAKIIDIREYSGWDNDYLLEFKDPIGNSYDGNGKGRIAHCGWCSKKSFKSIDHLKFKKWIRG